MPNRLLKEGIVDSEKINELTPEAEVFFYRLLVVSDDYGRMDARPTILRSRCFPLKNYDYTQIVNFVCQLSVNCLAGVYQSNDKLYIQILNWSHRQRSHSKYPEPKDNEFIMLDEIIQKMSVICPSIDRLGLGKGLGKGWDSSMSEEEYVKPKLDRIPYQQILDLYHNKLPRNPKVAALTDKRKNHIAARWNSGRLPDIETWNEYFTYVSESDFLTGKIAPINGRKLFLADIDWLINENNMVKVYEGKYHGK